MQFGSCPKGHSFLEGRNGNPEGQTPKSLKQAIEFDQGLLVKRYVVEPRDFNPGFLKAVRDGISGKSRVLAKRRINGCQFAEIWWRLRRMKPHRDNSLKVPSMLRRKSFLSFSLRIARHTPSRSAFKRFLGNASRVSPRRSISAAIIRGAIGPAAS